MIFRNFNIYVSSAANLVYVERVLSQKLQIWLCLFFLLVKIADMGHSKISVVTFIPLTFIYVYNMHFRARGSEVCFDWFNI